MSDSGEEAEIEEKAEEKEEKAEEVDNSEDQSTQEQISKSSLGSLKARNVLDMKLFEESDAYRSLSGEW